MSPGRWQRPWEGDNVLRKVAMSPGRWQHPCEGDNVPRRVAVFPGRWHRPQGSTTGLSLCSDLVPGVVGVPAAVGAALFEGDDQGDALEVPGGTGDTGGHGGRGSVGPGMAGSPPALAPLAMGAPAPPCPVLPVTGGTAWVAVSPQAPCRAGAGCPQAGGACLWHGAGIGAALASHSGTCVAPVLHPSVVAPALHPGFAPRHCTPALHPAVAPWRCPQAWVQPCLSLWVTLGHFACAPRPGGSFGRGDSGVTCARWEEGSMRGRGGWCHRLRLGWGGHRAGTHGDIPGCGTGEVSRRRGVPLTLPSRRSAPF